jgi:hypothetical protein
VSLATVGNVVLQSRSQNKILDHQIAVQGPDEFIGLAVLGVGRDESAEGSLDEGVVLLDRL